MLERCLQDLRLQGLRLQELWLHLRYMLYLERVGGSPQPRRLRHIYNICRGGKLRRARRGANY